MIRVGICDDMPEETIRQKGMVERIGKRSGMNMEILIFEEGEELLQEIQSHGHIDILLLDIEMGGINGIETARIIRESDFQTVLIFISAYDQYCKEMISVQPFAFLDKPVKEEELERVLKRVIDIKFAECERFLFFSQKHRYSIPLHQILYFESKGRQICIYCEKEKYLFYGKLNAVEKEIEKSNMKFARIHVSYFINLNHIKEWNYDSVIMDDNMEIPVSKKYRKAMKQHYMEMLGNKNEKEWPGIFFC